MYNTTRTLVREACTNEISSMTYVDGEYNIKIDLKQDSFGSG